MTNLEQWQEFEKVAFSSVGKSSIKVDEGYDYNLSIVSIDGYIHTLHFRNWEDTFQWIISDSDGYTINEIIDSDYLKLYEWLFRILEKCY